MSTFIRSIVWEDGMSHVMQNENLAYYTVKSEKIDQKVKKNSLDNGSLIQNYFRTRLEKIIAPQAIISKISTRRELNQRQSAAGCLPSL